MGRLETWIGILLGLAVALASLGVGMIQAGAEAMSPYVSDFDVTVKALFGLAALALLGSLLGGIKLAVGSRKGKRSVSDEPQSGPSISGDINVSNTHNTGHIGHVQNIGQMARTLKGIDVEPFRQQLAAYPGTGAYVSSCGDGEATSFCVEMRDFLRSAGWNARLGTAQVMMSDPYTGILIMCREASPALRSLQKVLQALGRKVAIREIPSWGGSYSTDAPDIVVGPHEGR